MIFEHGANRPKIHESAYVAPTAVVAGDVSVGENSRILFGAVITADGGPVAIGRECIIMENAVLRGTHRHPLRLGNHILVGPRACLTGCTVEDNAFLATGATVFNGARIETGSEVRINGVVHLMSRVAAGNVVPIGWVAIGDPAHVLPPGEHEKIWSVQEPLNFPKEVFGLERGPMERVMPELTRRYARALERHKGDRRLDS
jgi:carbonic anhydrase/acetyltransferase-like protein (isoleucine patch superfamily)